MSKIETIIGKAALLEQLAEEASELAQAALKYARILRDNNPTPVTEKEACEHMTEEYTDVIHNARELGLQVDEDQIVSKGIRWENRIRESLINDVEYKFALK